ncbi:DUF6220 domain-containing protein [Amycolatopsis alkalitolerans]|uniref:Uncharacterized protein n=1 Tax=Amycolatopsis alkalitolerans TaxID=2547244 RepID=A0A5C4M971_9PSEU|nr:DUF6220 domain-containing protein [Amycolatopsis alkalitolerans]TNC28449.1 hypothetical protein FG385_03985 [Amycolatopsis alkalitolerans]
MRTVYRVLAYLLALEVVVQAAAMVYAVAGLGRWIDNGGVADKATLENDDQAFSEAVGFIAHGINGSMVVPAIVLLLLIVSFFARIPRGSWWALGLLLLVALQAELGFLGHSTPLLGLLHGINALAVFTVALVTARRAKTPKPVPAEPVADRAEV